MSGFEVAAALFSVATEVVGGISQNNRAKANAKRIEKTAAVELSNARRDNRRRLARSFAKSGASGVAAPIDLLADQAFEDASEAFYQKYTRDVQAYDLRRKGQDALVGGIIGGATKLFMGQGVDFGSSVEEPLAQSSPRRLPPRRAVGGAF